MRPTTPTAPAHRIAALLFLCLFASQAAILVLAPTLSDVARDLGVSKATVGQLRSVSGAVGGVAALVIGFAYGRSRLRSMLRAGLLLVAGGSALSAAAPGFAVLLAAQVAIGAGVAAILSGGIAAAGAWSAPGDRARVLSWAIVGQPGAWVVGLPVVGAVSDASWRLTWLAVPLVAALLGLLALRLVPPVDEAPDTEAPVGRRSSWGNRPVLGWAAGELLSSSAWAGTLVYAGVLFMDKYGLSTATVSLILAGSAVAYFPGAFAARRLVGRDAHLLLVGHAAALSAGVAVFDGTSAGLAVTVAVFMALAFVAGARSVVTSAFGLDAAPREGVVVMSLRTASLQFGYLVGAGLGGLALALGDYGAVAVVYATLFALSAVPHLVALRPRLAWPGRAQQAAT